MADETTKKVVYEDEDEVKQPKVSLADDVEFGDEDTMSYGDGFDKISPNKDDKSSVVRTNLLTDVCGPKKDWVHYPTGKGPIKCFSDRDAKGNIKPGGTGRCCKELTDDRQKAILNIGVLAFHYLNAEKKTGRYPKDNPPPIEWALGYVNLSKSGFRRVSMLIQEDQKSHEFDLLTAHKAAAAGYDYSVIATKCRFRQNAELVKEVMEAAAEYADGVKLSAKMRKVVTEIEFLAMIGGGKAAKSAVDANIDDVGNL